MKPAAGLCAAIKLGPGVLTPNADGIAAVFPEATSLFLWVAAVAHDRGPGDRRVLGWFWLWASSCFANRALRDMGWPTWPAEWLVLSWWVLPLAAYFVWRSLREPGSRLRWPAVAVVVIVVVAFAWPCGASIPSIIAGGSLVYGLLSCLALASIPIFRPERKAHA